MGNMIRNSLSKFPLIRGIIKRLNNLEASQRKMDLLIDNVKTELRQTKIELTQTKNELKYIRKDIEYRYSKLLPSSEYEKELKYWYKSKTNKVLDLENPKTFNEKIQWLKLYDRSPIKTKLSDKYLVRDWVKQKIGEQYLIPLIGVWDDFDEIDFDTFPQQFVLKANHGCGWNIIVKDKDSFDKEDARNKFDKWLNHNFAFDNGFELQYEKIEPKIIAEQYLENYNGNLVDYKVWCFDGEPKYIMFLSDRQTSLKMAFYDLNWNLEPFVYSYPRYEKSVKKPENLDELINISRNLCQDFSHVRVDFYRLNNGEFKFGEMTFTSASGECEWDPEEYDNILGKLIKLPNERVT